jgi:hypothetical protein
MEQAVNPNTTDLITPEQPPEIAAMLDALPGLVGAIDTAIKDTAGKQMPFVLLVFPGNGALHATNISPASQAVDAVKKLAAAWNEQDNV